MPTQNGMVANSDVLLGEHLSGDIVIPTNLRIQLPQNYLLAGIQYATAHPFTVYLTVAEKRRVNICN